MVAVMVTTRRPYLTSCVESLKTLSSCTAGRTGHYRLRRRGETSPTRCRTSHEQGPSRTASKAQVVTPSDQAHLLELESIARIAGCLELSPESAVDPLYLHIVRGHCQGGQ